MREVEGDFFFGVRQKKSVVEVVGERKKEPKKGSSEKGKQATREVGRISDRHIFILTSHYSMKTTLYCFSSPFWNDAPCVSEVSFVCQLEKSGMSLVSRVHATL